MAGVLKNEVGGTEGRNWEGHHGGSRGRQRLVGVGGSGSTRSRGRWLRRWQVGGVASRARRGGRRMAGEERRQRAGNAHHPTAGKVVVVARREYRPDGALSPPRRVKRQASKTPNSRQEG